MVFSREEVHYDTMMKYYPELSDTLLPRMIELGLAKKAASDYDDIAAMAKPHYPDSGSHGWSHIEDVLASARRMRRKELLKKELAALMYHDSSLLTGPRETHAEDSAAIAGRELAGKFSKRQLADIVNAIAHHRASYEGRRKSRLEDLVAAADRDVFPDGNIDDYIMRSYRYGLEHGMTPDEAVDNTFHHMPDKYGTKGYAYENVPKIYMDTYGDEVRKAQKAFDGITPEQIRGIVEKSASAMSRDRIQAQYARHPQSSLDMLAKRLARKKWGKRDVAREDAAHADEFGATGEDKEYLDRYIIARIAEQYDRKARCKQAILRALWEKGHSGESFDAALPSRMARFRQYEDSPFGKYDNPIEQAKYDEWAAKSDEDMEAEWGKYLKN